MNAAAMVVTAEHTNHLWGAGSIPKRGFLTGSLVTESASTLSPTAGTGQGGFRSPRRSANRERRA